MDNINFLKEILMSTECYWVVAKKNEVSHFSRVERADDSIIFIAIPHDIERGLPYEEITLKALENLQRLYCDQNIFINGNYSPFQTGQTFYNIYKGFPVSNPKEFLIQALALQSSELWDYKKLLDQKLEPCIE